MKIAFFAAVLLICCAKLASVSQALTLNALARDRKLASQLAQSESAAEAGFIGAMLAGDAMKKGGLIEKGLDMAKGLLGGGKKAAPMAPVGKQQKQLVNPIRVNMIEGNREKKTTGAHFVSKQSGCGSGGSSCGGGMTPAGQPMWV